MLAEDRGGHLGFRSPTEEATERRPVAFPADEEEHLPGRPDGPAAQGGPPCGRGAGGGGGGGGGAPGGGGEGEGGGGGEPRARGRRRRRREPRRPRRDDELQEPPVAHGPGATRGTAASATAACVGNSNV